jgi:hypothetical protein
MQIYDKINIILKNLAWVILSIYYIFSFNNKHLINFLCLKI